MIFDAMGWVPKRLKRREFLAAMKWIPEVSWKGGRGEYDAIMQTPGFQRKVAYLEDTVSAKFALEHVSEHSFASPRTQRRGYIR